MRVELGVFLTGGRFTGAAFAVAPVDVAPVDLALVEGATGFLTAGLAGFAGFA